MPDRWQCFDEDEILIEYFEDSAALYCIASGETHIVDAFPAEILKLMIPGSSVDLAALSTAFAASVGDAAELWSDDVEAVLRRLEQMGIIAAVPV